MPRLNKRRLQVANRKRNTDGCFSKIQEQQRFGKNNPRSIEQYSHYNNPRKSWRYMDAYDKGGKEI